MPRRPNATQSVQAAVDAILLDDSWQRNLSDDQRGDLVEWARRTISYRLEESWRSTSAELARIHGLPAAERDQAINALVRAGSNRL